MIIKCRHGLEFDMHNVRSFEVVETRIRSKIHFGWWVVIFLLFWPGLLAYPFVGKRVVYTVSVQKGSFSCDYDVYEEGLEKMNAYLLGRKQKAKKSLKYC